MALLFRILAAALEAAGPDQLRLCLGLLSSSAVIITSLQLRPPVTGREAAVAAGAVQLLQLVAARGVDDAAAAACKPMLDAISGAFHAAINAGGAGAASAKLPAGVFNFLATLEALPLAEVRAALEPLLALAEASCAQLRADSWVLNAATAVLQHLLKGGAADGQAVQRSFGVLKLLLSRLQSRSGCSPSALCGIVY